MRRFYTFVNQITFLIPEYEIQLAMARLCDGLLWKPLTPCIFGIWLSEYQASNLLLLLVLFGPTLNHFNRTPSPNFVSRTLDFWVTFRVCVHELATASRVPLTLFVRVCADWAA